MADRQNARALRVIGQDLAAQGVNQFNLGRQGDDFTVWIESRESTQDQMPFIMKVFRALLKKHQVSTTVSKTIHFATSQILWTDVARSFIRKGTQEITDLNELSLRMRALGDFLDDNQCDDFVIFWERNRVKVLFNNRERNFSALDLYHRGTHLHLNRSIAQRSQ